ncbi:IclR family transcriptional regulator domain-containing protein [Noviherbaspirillum pedocola]|uniref:Helix-turn-helix domain-containing protein n=1 Tax=Noviherbaspirillum pedocola TaxID=2801341 RepID=A0A934SWG7_9BURK|nr:IclR family transcriptional regulator C-terminal domain-containing protein [Noviherbaspirillum pedocola]MBK4736683.1 helix-turn-helix domain-containing protein [Noviherbaspirillum pedocola]
MSSTLPQAPDAGATRAPREQHEAIPVDANAQLAQLTARYGDDPDFVTGLARGIAVMQALADKRRRMSIAQVSHLTDIPRAAARRSLHTLVKLGFVAQDEARRFYLRPRVLSIGHAYLSATPLAVLAQPVLDRLGEELQQACSLAVLDGEEIVYLARASSSPLMSPALNVGRRLPAYCTSIGRLLLSRLPEQELEAYLSGGKFYAYTSQTLTRPEDLREALARVREDGYAYSKEQLEPRICSLAVPVRDIAGNEVAGINVILQGSLMSEKAMAGKFLQPMTRAARELGAMLAP